MNLLTEGRLRDTPAGVPVPNLRRVRCGSHFIFFLREERFLTIVRVLHERMDFVRHLTDS